MDRRSLLRCLAALPFVPSALTAHPDGSCELLEDGKRVSAWDTDVYSVSEYTPKIELQTPDDFFGWSPGADGVARIYERGECVGEFGPWTPFTVFTVDLDINGRLSYSKDGVICRQVAPEVFGELSGIDPFSHQSRVDGQSITFLP